MERPLYPAFVLLLVYGLRRGEVLGLSWEDIDLDEDVMRVLWQIQRVDGQLSRTEVKTDAGKRDLPLLPLIRDGFIELSERQMFARRRAGDTWQETGLVFTTKSGRPIEPRNLAPRVRAGLPQGEASPDPAARSAAHHCVTAQEARRAS